jgi:hypothetical protein
VIKSSFYAGSLIHLSDYHIFTTAAAVVSRVYLTFVEPARGLTGEGSFRGHVGSPGAGLRATATSHTGDAARRDELVSLTIAAKGWRMVEPWIEHTGSQWTIEPEEGLW